MHELPERNGDHHRRWEMVTVGGPDFRVVRPAHTRRCARQCGDGFMRILLNAGVHPHVTRHLARDLDVRDEIAGFGRSQEPFCGVRLAPGPSLRCRRDRAR
jgi:hypothetical protein